MINQGLTATQNINVAQDLKLREILGETENLVSQSLNFMTGMGKTPEPGNPKLMPESFIADYIDRLSTVNQKLSRLNFLLMRL